MILDALFIVQALCSVPPGTEMDNNASEVPVPTMINVEPPRGSVFVQSEAFRVEELKSSEIIAETEGTVKVNKNNNSKLEYPIIFFIISTFCAPIIYLIINHLHFDGYIYSGHINLSLVKNF